LDALREPNVTLCINGNEHRIYDLAPLSIEFGYVKESPFYIRSASRGIEATFIVAGDRSFVQRAQTLQLHSEQVVMDVQLRDEMVADWVAEVDRVGYSVDVKNRRINARHFIVLTSSSQIRQRTVPFGAISLEGLESVVFEIFKVEGTLANAFVTQVARRIQLLENDGVAHDLEALV
jgi:hypothetical protein